MNRIADIGTLSHSPVKFGNDFCNGPLALYSKAGRLTATGLKKYIYPIFEILN